jgi:mono/diheme cytochrome c family protein/plastocyanin
MRREWLARAILVSFVGLTALAVALGWHSYQDRLILHARMPEQGGWNPSALSTAAGKPLRLRLTSDDVTHSFAVGKTDWPVVDVHPGEVVEVVLTFDHPGKYVFYCTRWCGPNHWRMRGTIEVASSDGLSTQPVVPEAAPLYVDLNLDIDAPHPASATPQVKPSPVAGMDFLEYLPPAYRTTDYLRSHSPAEVWQALRAEPSAKALSDRQVWDLVAALWQLGTSPQKLDQGKDLYAQNCAACHGEDGAGDGVFPQQMGSPGDLPGSTVDGYSLKVPADFTDSSKMLGASPALLQGKIMRGGMGTGMPYWGPIFTRDQIWEIVDYLYTFQFGDK